MKCISRARLNFPAALCRAGSAAAHHTMQTPARRAAECRTAWILSRAGRVNRAARRGCTLPEARPVLRVALGDFMHRQHTV